MAAGRTSPRFCPVRPVLPVRPPAVAGRRRSRRLIAKSVIRVDAVPVRGAGIVHAVSVGYSPAMTFPVGTASLVAWGGVVKVRPSGLSVSAATPFPRAAVASKRGKIRGWSRKSAARHVRWLQSVESDKLDGHAYGCTFTVKHLPPDAAEWARVRREFLASVREELPLTRGHWVTEWTRRGLPHLHAALYFDRPLRAREHGRLVSLWCAAAAKYGARSFGQDVKLIRAGNGWSRYLAKHSARSAAHYQRSGMPTGWESSGRLWGHFGDWPTASASYVLNPVALVHLRRLVRSWSTAQARLEAIKTAKVRSTELDLSRVRFTRRMLAANTPERAAVRGITEWAPAAVVERMLDWVQAQPGAIVGADWYDLLPSGDVARARAMSEDRLNVFDLDSYREALRFVPDGGLRA